MKLFPKLLFAGLVVFALLQAVRPTIPTRPATAELQAPAAVKHVFEKNCYSCHSNQRRLSWFDEIEPAYWFVRKDILMAREHLNFSTIGSKPPAAQKATLYEAINMIQLGAMPLPQFVLLHPEARVSPEELATVKEYLAPWSPAPSQPSTAPGEIGAKANAAPSAVSDSASPVALASVPPEFNGFPFDSSFENWKLISATDRGDNNTFRFILGNDVAIRAAQAGAISPWPDGARFAKIAWQQQAGADGLIYPGEFVQVEFMAKGAQVYKRTDGWGWGRWRGLDLKPYGKDAHFVDECTGCHLPVRGNDFVYTLPITQAKVDRSEVVNTLAASLPAALPHQPLSWNAITMYVDPKTLTVAILFGNDAAFGAIQPRTSHQAPMYPSGSVLSLVTWVQRDDPHWFGARIPAAPLSVEFVQSSGDGKQASYRRFTGTALAKQPSDSNTQSQRTRFILGLNPAQLP